MNASDYINQCRNMGEKAAEARHNRAESSAQWFHSSAERVFRMFKGDDRALLQKAFDDGYRDTSKSYTSIR